MSEQPHTADIAHRHLSLVKSDIADIRACQERDGVDHICGDPDRCEETNTLARADLGPLGHEFRTGKFGGDACVFEVPRLCGRGESEHHFPPVQDTSGGVA
jgi:hypothetical protein